jgi:N-acetyl sugar amidotransferase
MNEVIVNGVKVDIPFQVCARCVQDSTVPGITFDDAGICNFCKLHDKLEKIFPNDMRGEAYLEKAIRKIKKKSSQNKYDCVVGISGGRDSTYTLYLAIKKWGLRPLAVHFNDGFDNPVAGENMLNACKILGVELITITSDWRESRELKIDFLKASTPDLNMGTDIGIAASLYGVAAKNNVRYILIGQSFRTEGVKPLSWSFFDGKYLKDVHNKFGKIPLRKWTPDDPGFNLGVKEMIYYSLIRGIHSLTPMYYMNYVRKDAEEIIKNELKWVYPGAHYFDDLYHSLIKYVHRVKFNIDLNMNSDSALVRSGQLERDAGLKRAHGIYVIEDEKIIELCIKRLGLTRNELDLFLELPPKTFRDYNTSYKYFKLFKYLIKILAYLDLIPRVTYDKYFNCGK